MFGLLGVLVTVGIMVFLAVQVLDGVGGGSGETDSGAGAAVLPGGVVVGGDPTAGGATAGEGPQAGTGSPADAARASACSTDKATIATAAEAYHVMNGAYPPDVTTLLAEGLVQSDHPLEFELQVQDGVLAVVGTGACAGG